MNNTEDSQQKKKKGFKVALSSAVAVVTAAVLAFTTMAPTNAFAQVDGSSMDSYLSTTGEASSPTSTKNAGRVWSDKTVLEGTSTVDGHSYDLAADENFNVVYSTMSSSARIKGQQASALDVVFILDTSGSMEDETQDGKKRINAAIEALNHSLVTLLKDNPYNRVGVATFAKESSILMPLNNYKQKIQPAWDEEVPGKWPWSPSQTIHHPETTLDFVSFDGSYVKANWDGGKKSVAFAGGTNTQRGFNEGMNMLLNEAETTVTIDGKTIQRVPVVVMLSDGASTYSLKDASWWNPTETSTQGPGNGAYYGNGMKAMMIAAYKKQEISKHYKANDTAIYTIGLGVGELSGDEKKLAQITLNPTAHWDDYSEDINNNIRTKWEDYLKGKAISVKVDKSKTYTAKHPGTGDITSLKYENGYFETSNAAELDKIFSQIVSEIVAAKPTYPTELHSEQNPSKGGYVTYTDPIGDYMEVKDVKSIIHNGKEFEITSQPVVTTSGNVETKTWQAEGTVTDPVSGQRVNVRDVLISVSGNKDGANKEQTMTIQVPASLIPLKMYDVELNVKGEVISNTPSAQPVTPIRVVYSVGLTEGVEQLTGVSQKYINENLENGKVNFYSNQFVKGAEKGSAVTRFTPSTENANYYFQKDTVIYRDKAMTSPVEENDEFIDGETYYINTPYYDGTTVKYDEVSRSAAQMRETDASRLTVVNGYKALKAGVPRTFHIMEDFKVAKAVNTTGTATHLYVPEIESISNDIIHTLSFAHGNNGKLQIEAAKDLIISKDVMAPEGITAPKDAVFTFDVTIASKSNETVTAKFKDAAGKVTDQKLQFNANGKASVTLKDKESIEIPYVNGQYEVAEQTPAEGFTVQIPANATGTVGTEKNEEVKFVNEYNVEPLIADQTQFGLPLTKTLNGKTFEADDTFTFKIEGTDALPEKQEVTIHGQDVLNQNKASADFGKFTFTKPGTYVYIISETAGNIAGIDYDIARYKLTVHVIDNGQGQLLQESVKLEKETTPNQYVEVPTGSNISFTNTFKAESASTSFTGKKVIENGNIQNYLSPFTFKLEAVTKNAPMPENPIATANKTDGTITFGTVSFETEHVGKTFKYVVEEVQPTKDGTYEGKAIQGAKKDAQGNWVYNGLTFDHSEKEITVQVTKKSQDGQSLVVLDVTGNNFEFTNTYNAEEIYYFTEAKGKDNGEKIIEGRTFKQGDRFTFNVTSPDVQHALPKQIEIVPTEGNNYKFDFGEVKFTQDDAGKSFTYIFKEEPGNAGGMDYDGSVKTVTLKVEDNYNGTLSVTRSGDDLIWKNVYSATFDDTTALTLDGIKNYTDMTGNPLTAGMFTFNVMALDQAPAKGVISTSVNDQDGVFNFFNGLTYTFEDMQGAVQKTFVYEVREFKPVTPKRGMTYDPAVYKVSVTVTDDLNGRLYIADDGVQITKQSCPGEVFKAVQKVEFNNEYKPEEEKVIPFETNGRPMLYKQLTGLRKDALKENEFSFTFDSKSLQPEDGVVIKNQGAVGNKADGSIEFKQSLLTFKKPGTYVFTISEDTSKLPAGVTSQVSEVEITYTVTDEDGKLVATPQYSGASQDGTIVNEYNAAGALASKNLEVTKEVVNRPWTKDDVFTFTLAANNTDTQKAIENELVTITKDTVEIKDATLNHKAQFGDIQFKVPGNFEFKVLETATGLQPGMHADTAERIIKVSVTDNGDGTLSAAITNEQEYDLTFVNKYEPEVYTLPGETFLKVKKELSGRPWQDFDSYSFELSGATRFVQDALAEDKVIIGNDPATESETITITKDTPNHTARFSDITFKDAGIYAFNIVESFDVATMPNVRIQGEAIQDIVVEVTLDASGKLNATVRDNVKGFTFNNVYTPTPVQLDGSANLQVTKAIANREWLDGETFEFEIKPFNGAAKDQSAVVMPENSKVTVSKEAQTNHFENITFKKAGHYVFTVTEQLPEGIANGTNGLTYDTVSRKVVVDVKDNYDGTLTITKDLELSEPLNFTNVYKPTPINYDGQTNLKVQKVIDGRNWQFGDTFKFTFEYDSQDQATVDAYRAHAFDLPVNANGITIEYKEGQAKDAYVASFGNMTFRKAGTYKFLMKEVQGSLGGVTYDAEAKPITITVTDDGKGTLTATSNDVTTFTNTYHANPAVFPSEGKGDLQVTKQFTGREWKDGDSFTFTLQPIGTYEPGSFVLGSTECTIQKSDSNKVASFGNITFNKPSPEQGYQFLIKEAIPEGVNGNHVKDGVQYDDSVRRVVIQVTDDGQGQLHATVDKDRTDTLLFENTYTPADVEVDPTTVEGTTGIKLNKVLHGRQWKDTDSFTFNIEALDGAPVPSKTSTTVHGENEKFDFGTIRFTSDDMGKATRKVFRYKVTEEIPEEKIPGVEYDTKSIIFKIVVTDDGIGSLVAEPFVENEADGSNKGEFNNVYTPANTTLDGSKYLKVTKNFTGRENDQWLPADEFTFQLMITDPATSQAKKDGNIILPDDAGGITIKADDPVKEKAFGDITFKKAGTYKFKVVETNQNIAGVTYAGPQEVTVNVVDNTNGELVASVQEGTELKPFVNEYKTGTTTLSGHDSLNVVKEINGRKWIESDAFTFTLEANNEATVKAIENGIVVMPADDEVKVTINNQTVGHKKHFGDITFTKAGKYEFKVTEQAPAGVEPDAAGQYKVDGVTYDTTPQVIKVEVIDDGDGTLSTKTDKNSFTFVNTYNHEDVILNGQANLVVQKAIAGRPMQEGDVFEFAMTAGNELASTVQLPANVKVQYPAESAYFDDITFTEPGKYVFNIQEIHPAVPTPSIGYNTEVKQVTVTVTDNLHGKLEASIDRQSTTFTNTYTPKEIILDGSKNLRVKKDFAGRPWQPGDVFLFTLTAADKATSDEIGKSIVLPANANQISISYTDEVKEGFFGGILFKKAGEYKFKITEKQESMANVTYDQSEKIITISVTDNKALGELKAVVTDGTENGSVTFTNTYQPDAYTLVGKDNLKVEKELTGRAWKEGDVFTFTLTPAQAYKEAEMVMSDPTSIEIAYNPAGSYVANFGNITFKKAGTYEFNITENVPENAIQGVTYDTPKKVTIDVKDDYKGKLHATVNGSRTTKFTNVYETEPGVLNGSTNLKVQKVFEGRPEWQTDDIFTFKLSGKTNATKNAIAKGIVQLSNTTVTIDKNTEGFAGAFGDITFNKAGSYVFEVEEVVTDNDPAYITYDKSKKQIYVEVTDDTNGQLVVALSDTSPTSVFTNTYNPTTIVLDGSKHLTVHKDLQGRAWTDGDTFLFTMTAEDNATKAAIQNGNVVVPSNFDEISISDTTPDVKKENFGDIQFNKAGTYVFRISENKGTIPAVAYESVDRLVTVVVTDDLKGNLSIASVTVKAEPSYEGTDKDNLVFTNTYSTEPGVLTGSTDLVVKKSITGRNFIEGDKFTFELTPVGEQEGVTLTNTTVTIENEEEAKGQAFGDITFTNPGTYTFKIHETSATAGMKNAADQTIVVKVTDDKQGHLKVSRTDASTLEFNNTYSSDPKTLKGNENFVVKKSIDGRNWKDGDKFTFVMEPAEDYGNKVELNVKQLKVTIENEREGKAGKAFGDITFNEAGTYKFTVHEMGTGKDGMTYDSAVRNIVVIVSHDYSTGKLVADMQFESGSKDLTFVNTYSPEEVLVDPTKEPDPDKDKEHNDPTYIGVRLEKVLEGREWMENDSFTFTMRGLNGAPAPANPTATITGPKQKLDFGRITFTAEDMGTDKVKKFEYVISEDIPAQEDKLPGMTYETRELGLTITVKDNDNGTLTAVVEETNDRRGLQFVNSYDPEEVPVDPTVKPDTTGVGLPFEKVLTGRQWKDTDAFQFELEALDENAPMPEQDKRVATITKAKQEFDFGTITFNSEDMQSGYQVVEGTKARIKEFHYQVTELPGTIPGITYDANRPIQFTITVMDDGSGKLSATVAKTDVSGNTQFTNTFDSTRQYEDPDGKSGLRIVKTLTGHDMADGQFKFDVQASDKKSEDKLGAKKIEVATSGVRPAGEPVEMIPFGMLHFDGNDIDETFTYVISEQQDGKEAGYVYDQARHTVKITVKEQQDGTLLPVTQVDDKVYEGQVAKVAFHNTFNAEGILNKVGEGNVKIETTKVLTGRNMNAQEFQFEVVDKNENVVATGTNAAAADGQTALVQFTEMKYDTAMLTADAKSGLAEHTTGESTYTYQYKVNEVQPAAETKVTAETLTFNIKVIVHVEEEGTLGFEVVYPKETDHLAFTNTYAPNEVFVDITGQKKLQKPASSSMTLEDIADKFTFSIVSQPAIYTPEVKEVVIEDVQPVSEEEMEEAEPMAEEVMAPVMVDESMYMPEKVLATNDQAGNVRFGKVRFDINALNGVQPDENGARTIVFNYRVDESGQVVGITNDGPQYFSIQVTDDGQGQLTASLVNNTTFTFNNVYTLDPKESSVTNEVSGNVQISKELTGRNLKNEEFYFVMNEIGNRTEGAEGTNDENGIVTMTAITFTEPGEYSYVVREEPRNKQVFDGITYDQTTYNVKATVTDNKDGSMMVVWSSDAEDVVFKNTYKADPTEFQIGAMKVLTGRELKAGEFEFVLKDAKGRVVDKAENQKDGTIQFRPIEFTQKGTYKYTIEEIKGREKGMTYDENKYTVMIQVEDDEIGHLTAARSNAEEAVVFVNKYEEPKVPVIPGGGNNTGYATGMPAWLGLMAISGTAIAGVTYKKRKSKK